MIQSSQKITALYCRLSQEDMRQGEVPQYYVEHSHEPIITPEEFDKVQAEFERRKRISRQYSGKSIFSSRIICGDCGSYFGSNSSALQKLHGKPRQKPSELSCSRYRSWTPSTSLTKNSG